MPRDPGLDHGDQPGAAHVILKSQAEVDDSVAVADVDPAVVGLNEDLGRAREELERSKAAASESWATFECSKGPQQRKTGLTSSSRAENDGR